MSIIKVLPAKGHTIVRRGSLPDIKVVDREAIAGVETLKPDIVLWKL